jgi:hypothetical protein
MTEPIDEGIAAFWRWWPIVRPRIEAAIHSGEWGAIPDEISAHVSAIDESLSWEFGGGQTAAHHLAVSSAGDQALRVVAERWLAAAPPADETWEFHPARQPRPDTVLTLGGETFESDDVTATWELDGDRERLDVVLYHPGFAELAEDGRMTAVFLLLDGALGEDGVERWIGGVDAAIEPLEGAPPFPALRDAVAELAAHATGEQFSILRGEDAEGRPLFVTLNQAIKSIDHLLLDTHVEIDLALLAPTEVGLTTNEEAEALNRLEDALLAQLGAEGVVYIGRETRLGRRVIHLHVAGASPQLAAIEAWAPQQEERDIEVRVTHDPTWQILARW